MADDESRATQVGFLPQIDSPAFWRLGRWGLVACAAVVAAFVVANSDLGMRRIVQAVAHVQNTPVPAQQQARDSAEVGRLTDTVRRLSIDRDRLQARLDALERNMSDLTGSIALSFTPPRPASISPTTPESMTVPLTAPASPTVNTPSPQVTNIPASAPTSEAKNVPAALNAPASVPEPVPPTQNATSPDQSGPARAEFGVDLGSAPNVDGLRNLWNTAKNRHSSLLDGLRPIISIREQNRPGQVELRLVVGPIPSAALAARICVVITATGSICQPAVFDGQRLAMR
jgi:hypothetical protein